MEVLIELCIKQVHDGSEYKGDLKIANTKLSYELWLAVPIPHWSKMGPPKNKDEFRRLVQLTMKCGDADIVMTEEEYGFFITLLGPAVEKFYSSQSTRHHNTGVTGMTLRNEGPIAELLGFAPSLCSTFSWLMDFSPSLCEMLNAEKFDCGLIA